MKTTVWVIIYVFIKSHPKDPRLEITGEKEVTDGRSLNLTCSFDTSPPSFITWTKRDINTTMSNGTGAATLFISNITAEQSGWYVCTAKHLSNTLRGEVDVKIKCKL